MTLTMLAKHSCLHLLHSAGTIESTIVESGRWLLILIYGLLTQILVLLNKFTQFFQFSQLFLFCYLEFMNLVILYLLLLIWL